MGKLRYNPETGSYELTEQQPQVVAPVVNKPQSSESENGFLTAEQMNAKREAEKAKAAQQPKQPEAPKDLIDVEALKKANEANITAQKESAEADQTARQSAIDAFGAQVQNWQAEYDAEQQAALDAEKRAKTSTLITSIADGLTALSNVYFAAQGAPSQKLYSGTQKYMDIYTRARDKREQLQREINRKLESGNLNLAQMRAEKIASKAKSDAAIAKSQADAEASIVSAQAKNRQYQEEIAHRNQKYQDTKEQQEKENEWAERRVAASEKNADSRAANSVKYTGTGSDSGGSGGTESSRSGKTIRIGDKDYSESEAAQEAVKYYNSRKKQIEARIKEIDAMDRKGQKAFKAERDELSVKLNNLNSSWEKASGTQAGKANFLQNQFGADAAESDDDFLAARKVKGETDKIDDKELEGYKVTE